MEFTIRPLSDRPYRLASPETLTTPCLLLFRDRIEHNIRKMGELLESLSPGFGFDAVWPHVKTHKSLWTTRKLIDAGFRHFKSTPNEVDMLVAAGAQTIFIAYPLVEDQAQRIAQLAKTHAGRRFVVQAAHPAQMEVLRAAADRNDIRWPYFIDLDVGMHRTGIHPEKAFDLYRSIPAGRFEFVGLHAYDGHNASLNLEERRKTTQASVDQLVTCLEVFRKEKTAVPLVIMGGTPSFLTDLEHLSRLALDTRIILSPGTWIYFDTMNDAIIPDTFQVAALILARIMDRPSATSATLNLGYKRWAIDQGPIEGFSVEEMRALSWSEEHTVVYVPRTAKVDIGDYVLIAPRHVCSTVNLWEHMTIIGPDGKIEQEKCPIDARNR